MKSTTLPASRKGKSSSIATIRGTKRYLKVIDQIQFLQSNDKNKVICLQRLRLSKRGIEFRLGYYIIGVKPGRKGKWVWGQYAPMLPKRDLRKVFREAVKKKWL